MSAVIFLQSWNYYYSEHRKRFEALEVKRKNDFLPHTEDSAYIFDAIWAAALALNRTKSILDEKNLSFKNFTYENGDEIAGYIYNEALKVNFLGLTVSINSVISMFYYYICMQFVLCITHLRPYTQLDVLRLCYIRSYMVQLNLNLKVFS